MGYFVCRGRDFRLDRLGERVQEDSGINYEVIDKCKRFLNGNGFDLLKGSGKRSINRGGLARPSIYPNLSPSFQRRFYLSVAVSDFINFRRRISIQKQPDITEITFDVYPSKEQKTTKINKSIGLT